jgi:L-ascorbate metabolism protein UlaG (beta-lactamase superfamily)
MNSKATHNPNLPFIKEGWGGNVVTKKNQYSNLDLPSEKTFTELLKWQKQKNPQKLLKKKQQSPIPIIYNKDISKNIKNGITWLGYASFIFTLNQLQIIVDPVFYNVGPIKRYTALPCKGSDLKDIDIILLSHNHRDHCDKRSMQELCKYNPKAIIITGLEIGALLKSWGIKNEFIEMGWYQQYEKTDQIKITYLPARHWNRRGLTDMNTMLWGSFMLESENQKIYFGADSGLGVHFKEIGKLFPNIDYALLGIGAYKPEWFMAGSHTSPKDALLAYKELGAAHLIPMHHGTFDLSDEPIFDPVAVLNEIVEKKNIKHVLNLTIGEKLFI